MDSRWFKEDRDLPRGEHDEAKEQSQKALRNSTLFQRRLERILEDLLSETDRSDADFNDINWSLKAAGNAMRRKTLNEIKQIIQLK